jgi:SAM-dependent methyltransferase
MGLGSGAVKIYLELWQRNLFANVESVMEVGSQELHLSMDNFKQLVDAAGIPDYDEKSLPNLDNWPAQPRCSARYFYEMLGAKQYRCMDLNQEFGAIAHDLNLPFTDESFYNQFDLVTDHGACEHVFNIAETYRTMHRLCKPGGMISIMQGVYGGNGYFNFDMSFFEGMAAANDYKILFSSFTISPPTDQGSCELHVPVSRELLTVVDFAKLKSLGICYIFQKTSDQDFQFAYQGSYLSQKQKNMGYRLQFLPIPPSRSYVPLVGTGENGLASIGTMNMIRYIGRRILARILRPFR